MWIFKIVEMENVYAYVLEGHKCTLSYSSLL